MQRILMIVTVFVLIPFTLANAKTKYLTTFNGLYGTADGTLDTCGTCHFNGFDLNDYAKDFKTENDQLGNETQAYQAIEGIDSDNDTYSNLAEINAGTFPGNDLSTLPTESSTWGKIKALYE